MKYILLVPLIVALAFFYCSIYLSPFSDSFRFFTAGVVTLFGTGLLTIWVEEHCG